MFIKNLLGGKSLRVSVFTLCLLFVVTSITVFAAPPIDLSTVNQYNQLSFGDANLTDGYVQGNVAYGGNATLNDLSLSTSLFNAPCPNGQTAVQVAGAVDYNNGTIFGGGGSYGTTLTVANQNFGCNLDNWTQAAPSVDFTAVENQLTTLSADLSSAVTTGPLKIRDCFISAGQTTSDLNVYNIDGSIFENLDPSKSCTFAINASCSATVVINISGTDLNLTNFDLTLGGGGVAPSQVLVNFYEAQTLNFNNVQFNGTILAPLATVTGNTSATVYNRIIGGLFAQELNGQFHSESAPFVAGPQNGCELTYDFGDLPDNYSVNLLENGARHELGDLFLGNTVDNEDDGQPSMSADGDAIGDDGIVTTPETWSSDIPNGGSLMTVASGDGCLNGWIDWNEDGDFDDANEHIIMNELVSNVGSTINFDVQYVPAGGTRYARFRLTERTDVNGQLLCVDDVAPTGFYRNGEVEDYQYIFADATAVTLSSAETTTPTLSLVLLLTLSLGMVTHRVVNRKES